MTVCPVCGDANAQSDYGGERGESGPWLHCEECGYNEEYAEKHANIAIDFAIKSLLGKGWIICGPGCLPMPRSLDEARAMNCLSERYIEDHK